MNILIYGTNMQAEALYRMITIEKQGNVSAFVVDGIYRKSDTFCGLPVFDFETIDCLLNRDEYKICLSFGYKNMVRNRQEKYWACVKKGIKIFTFISKNAAIYTDDIGEGCIVCPGTVLAPCVKLGRGTFVECGCIVAHHTRIGEFNFIAPGAHFCGGVTTGDNCFIGAASEIINNINLGNYSFVGASAKVSKNLGEHEVALPGLGCDSPKTSFEMMNYMFRN